MSEEPKKISFGFTKVSKKTNLMQPKKDEVKSDVQFIDCLEGKSIKIIGGEKLEKELPIIPMRNGNSLKDSIRDVVKSRERNVLKIEAENVEQIKDVSVEKKDLTLEELAAKEILDDLNKSKDEIKEDNQLAVPVTNQIINENKESTLEDYESMPITDFGLAMLRGMGWDPKKGIGLNGKIVTPLAPSLRPKGMGLGADKVPANSVTSNGEVLIMKKGAPVKILSGPHINLYAKIEGFDELPGRLLVRIAKNNVIVSLNEIMVQLVSFSEYNKGIEGKQSQSLEQTEQKITDKKEYSSTLPIPNKVQNSEYGLKYQKSTTDKANGETRLEVQNMERESRLDEKKLISERFYDQTKTKIGRYREKRRSSSSSTESSSTYKQLRRSPEKKYHSKSRDPEHSYKGSKKYYSRRSRSKERISSKTSSNKKKSRRKDKYSSSETESDEKYVSKKFKKGKRSTSTDSNSSIDTYKKSHSKKHKKHSRR